MSSRSVKSLTPSGKGKSSDMVSDLGCNLGLDMGSWSLAMWVIIIVVPLLVWFILVTWQPSWVKDDNGNGGVVNNQKVFIWTVVITIIVWIVMWILWRWM